MKSLKIYLLLGFSLLLIGCSGQQINAYEANKPSLDLYRYFSGTINGWGMFQKRNGEVQKRFLVTIKASQTNGVITLDEQFTWDDGSKTERIWTITKQSEGNWRGVASDVIGNAVGQVKGNALQWKYQLALPVNDKVYHVNFDDWMYLIDENVMLNRSVMSKWGITLGSVTLTLQKQNANKH